jgi:hypothetical protein
MANAHFIGFIATPYSDYPVGAVKTVFPILQFYYTNLNVKKEITVKRLASLKNLFLVS